MSEKKRGSYQCNLPYPTGHLNSCFLPMITLDNIAENILWIFDITLLQEALCPCSWCWCENSSGPALQLQHTAQQSRDEELQTTNQQKCGGAGYRSRYLSHAKRALYHLSYAPCVRGDSCTAGDWTRDLGLQPPPGHRALHRSARSRDI